MAFLNFSIFFAFPTFLLPLSVPIGFYLNDDEPKMDLKIST